MRCFVNIDQKSILRDIHSNHDHILRQRALNKLGARGTSDLTYPYYSIYFPTMRYIAFDTFLVYGKTLYEEPCRKVVADDGFASYWTVPSNPATIQSRKEKTVKRVT